MALREYLYRDPDGELRWHDHPQGQQPKAAGGRYFGANGWSTGWRVMLLASLPSR